MLDLDQALDGRRSLGGAAQGSDSLAEIERVHIRRVLEACAWQLGGPGQAAERLGLNPSTLRSRMRKLGLLPPQGHGK